ncbi:AAA family ATPase [Aeromicrobium phragmitis]|uniref:AAA family ATPase n=1 Tax=Aeromicrobium phragmitis TaxID=2478914 RepID=UPI0014097BCF|nr:AAA family ATPase [Aeromicrobium phragmitis]
MTDEQYPPYTDADTPAGTVTPLRPLTNLAAEQALIGAILLQPQTAAPLLEQVDPDDFDDPRHETIWQAIDHIVHTDGLLPDHILIAEHLRETGDLPRVAAILPHLTTACPSPAQAAEYARLVRHAAIARRATSRLNRAQQQLTNTTPELLPLHISEALQELDDITRVLAGHNAGAGITTPTIDELLDGDDDEPDWVVPGLLEHQDRVIVTAAEGAGKSTLLRQIAVTAASGIHPFTGEPITPVRVLHVDVENSWRQSRRRYRPLRLQAGDRLDPENLRIELKTSGLDLTTVDDRDWLARLCTHLKPDLLLIGPIYKLAGGDPTEEQSAKPVALAIDAIREKVDCAVILEAHSAKKPSGAKDRPAEPYGWSGWMRWPELGIWLGDDGTIKHWRGAREEREWPMHLQRGGEWPWMPSVTDLEERWHQIRRARTNARRPLTMRDLEQATGMSRSTVARVVGKGSIYGDIWASFNANQHPGDEPR